jgi:uncharacterized protein (TIGR03437 family)
MTMHPRPSISSLAFAALAMAVLPQTFAAPAITAVMNAASNTPPPLPTASLAPGSIFIVKGTGLGPATLATASAAFQSTTLSGTSVSLTVAGTKVDALMYYTSDKQIAALLPSNTPAGGPGTITVTYNGQSSPATAFRGVVANNLGVFSVDSSGQGAGIVTYADYSLVSPAKATNCGGPNTTCGAANPGDTLILWGTGLGAITGSDASGAGLGQNMPNLPLNLFLGGVQAKVIYQGRSGCCIGEDQIVFTIPDNVPLGCAVPLAVQINNQVSNNVLIPIAKGSRDCTPLDPVLLSVGSAKLQQGIATGISLGDVELDHFLNDNGVGFHDVAQIFFARSTKSPVPPLFAATAFDRKPLGTCLAAPNFGGGDNGLGTLTPVDGGTKFTITGPGGTQTVTANPGDKVALSTAGTFLIPGSYTITGTGGKDVGAFTATVNIPISPTLTSPKSPTGLIVSKSQGMTVTWNGNGSAGHVELVLASPSASDPSTQSSVICTVPASAGTFTIPPYMLFTLTNTGNGFFAFQLGDQGPATSAPFSAPGLDAGFAQAFVDIVSFGGFSIAN